MLNLTHHIAIICSDRDEALDFYIHKLGFAMIREAHRPQQGDILIMLQQGETVLELFIKADAPQRVNDPEALGLRHLAFRVENMDEYCLGNLIYFFEKACGISGYVLGVNPFDQPGVEDYKKNMFALLGKPGYEAQQAELQARL